MVGEVKFIYRYPVKGLSPESISTFQVDIDGAIPGDRRFALALGSTHFDASAPHWLPKSSFLALFRNEKLATLTTKFNEESGELTILREDKQVAHGKITDPVGKAIIEDFIAAYLRDQTRGRPRLVESKGGTIFTDQKKKVLSLINLASVKDLERVAGRPIDPLRFRGNLYIDGLDPWEEFNWIGQDMHCGTTGLNIKERTERCAAINVNPETGEKDINLVNALNNGFGHIDMGVFATVTEAGTLSVGDALTIP